MTRDNLKDQIELAVSYLLQGRLIIFPTDTVYGIGCDMYNSEAVKNIFLAKGREFGKPLTAHVGTIEQIQMVAKTENTLFAKLYEAFLPGPLAIILPKKSQVSNLVSGDLDTISIRFPDCSVSIELAKLLGRPITATSANLSGCPAPIDVADISKELFKKVEFIISLGKTKYQKESTIIDLTLENPTIRRVGAVPVEKLEKVLGSKVDIINRKSR